MSVCGTVSSGLDRFAGHKIDWESSTTSGRLGGGLSSEPFFDLRFWPGKIHDLFDLTD